MGEHEEGQDGERSPWKYLVLPPSSGAGVPAATAVAGITGQRQHVRWPGAL